MLFIKKKLEKEPSEHFRVDENGVLWYDNRLVVPKEKELKEQILAEAHSSALSIYPGSNKMYRDLRTRYWWKK